MDENVLGKGLLRYFWKTTKEETKPMMHSLARPIHASVVPHSSIEWSQIKETIFQWLQCKMDQI